MAAGKEIRGKIKSVENTKKITKAMEMVAASKMRKAQDRMRAARPFAEKVRLEAGLATSAVGLITTAQQAEGILEAGQADAVMLAREALRDPMWALRAAHDLGVENEDAPWARPRWRGHWR